MKATLIQLIIFVFSIINLNLFGAVVPSVISSDLSLPAGTHTISNSTVVQAGVTLTFSPVSTLQFVNANGKLTVLGTLNANETTFTGDAPADRWGQILCEPGSECTLLSCIIDNGGGTSLPVPISNGMFFAIGANITISNTVAANPRGDCFGFKGGNISFFDNVAVAQNPTYGVYAAAAIYGSKDWPTVWQSSGNILTGATRKGIWLEGDFTKDLSIAAQDVRLNVANIDISNSIFTISAGTQLGFYDNLPGSLCLNRDATLMAVGTESSEIVFSNFYGNNPWTMKLLSGSKANISHANIYWPISFSLSNAYICLSNSYFSKLQNGLDVNYESEMCAFGTTFSGMVNQGLMIQNSSIANLRECSFLDNNPPYMNSLYIDGTSIVDARYCWWNAGDGPYPYGSFSNERINTNGNIKCFPWLIAAPGSQTNPPTIEITSHSGEPIVVSSPQILLKGIATDNTKITRVEFRNLNSKVVGEASLFNGTSWWANIWLFNGANQIGITAYDDEGNATVVGTIIDCTGNGVGNGGVTTPSLIPIPDRAIEIGQLLEFGVAATSRIEPAILTYWAANLPAGAEFNPVSQKFSWVPTVIGVYSNISFLVTDGTHIDTNKVTLTVTASPTVNVLTETLPDAYVDYPYYFHLADDSIDGPVTWEYNDPNLPPGLYFSESGIICGTPFGITSETVVNFTAKAINEDGIESKTKSFTLNIRTIDPPDILTIPVQEIPYKLNGEDYALQLSATNGSAPYTWVDIAGLLQNSSGLSLSSNGLLSGTANANGVVPVTWYIEDQSNKTTFANIPIPIIKSQDYLMTLAAGVNKCKIIIKRVPGKTRKCKMIVKTFLNVPAGFDFDDTSLAVCKIGYGFIDAHIPAFKFIPDKKLLYKLKSGFIVSKVLVKKLSDGRVLAKFILKNVDYNNTFNEFGIIDETNPAAQAILPVWIRIDDYCTETINVPMLIKSKQGKFTKCKAKW